MATIARFTSDREPGFTSLAIFHSVSLRLTRYSDPAATAGRDAG
jgi:hypothetical protein